MTPPPSPTSPVRVVGRYVLHDEIASGGMATVHIGRLLGPVGFSRTVAIKRLHPQFAKEPDFASMFLDEARVAARIRHPNVVGTLDVVALDDELFLVMEYVQGESLARILRPLRERGMGVPVPIAASIIVGVLEGLHAAHEATSDRGDPLGIVHRDVSPQNVLVGTDGVARVVDFGVAKAAGRVQTTRDGQLKGKLGYMAPEQITGNATRATDIHAASVVLWEMLAARRLYHGENDLQTYSNILAGNVLAPSKFNSTVSPELDRVVLRGLAANPLSRFATAREMARAIQRATPVAPPSDVGEWVERLAGVNIVARARKVAAIESSGTLPSSLSGTELDASRTSHPPSQSPFSVSRAAPPRSKVALVIPLAIAMASVGTAAALLARAMKRSMSTPAATSEAAPVKPAMGTAESPSGWAVATSIPSGWREAKVPEGAPSSQPPSMVVGAQPPQVVPGAPSLPMAPGPQPPSVPPGTAPASASASATAVVGVPPQPYRPATPWIAPQPGFAPPPAAPRPPTPQPGGKDFAHVMDSRK